MLKQGGKRGRVGTLKFVRFSPVGRHETELAPGGRAYACQHFQQRGGGPEKSQCRSLKRRVPTCSVFMDDWMLSCEVLVVFILVSRLA